MKIYIGYDPAERDAYNALVKSARRYDVDIDVQPLAEEKLRSQGLYTRPVDKRDQYYDVISNAPCSTEFATSRFLTPILAQSGWALFMDCDMVFMSDPLEIMKYADTSKAVMVVKHTNGGGGGQKMGGMEQTRYPRKNWSSVMLFNCDHPSNKRLSLRDVNERPGRDLHAFYWLANDEIGSLPPEWNWLVNVNEKPVNPKIAHFTLGGPWIEGWPPSPNDNLWLKYHDHSV